MFFSIIVLLYRPTGELKYAGLPLGQEKFEKITKVRKKWGVLKKSQEKSGNFKKLKKDSDFVSLNLQNSLFSKAFKW